MTLRTTTKLRCACGHEGVLHSAENDAPFSKMWERYRVTGFEAHEVVRTSLRDLKMTLMEELSPTCPTCGETGKVQMVAG